MKSQLTSPEQGLRVRFEASPTRCPYCHSDVDRGQEEWVACSGCLARHHRPCWDEAGQCSACAGAVSLVTPAQTLPPLPGDGELTRMLQAGERPAVEALLRAHGASEDDLTRRIADLAVASLEARVEPLAPIRQRLTPQAGLKAILHAVLLTVWEVLRAVTKGVAGVLVGTFCLVVGLLLLLASPITWLFRRGPRAV